MSGVSRGIGGLGVVFDDGSLVADAGLLAVGTLWRRLGAAAVLERWVRLGKPSVGARPGAKVLTLVAAMLTGATHIDHASRLRAGATRRVLGFRVMAASTLGTFLRAFTWGNVRQLDAAATEILARAWATSNGPADRPLTIDVDSTICPVSGRSKAGAAYGYTRQLGYHPLLATRADTGEVIAWRLRKGSSQQGNTHFIVEAVHRARRAGAAGEITVRADAAFWSRKLIADLDRLDVGWSITVRRTPKVAEIINAIPPDAWTPIGYPTGGEAEVAETTLPAAINRQTQQLRLVVRRTRLTEHDQRTLWPDWRYHPIVTNTPHSAVAADEYHRKHAGVELAIRDLKGTTGLAHCPSGNFNANAAWLACAALAHNTYRWLHHHTGQRGTKLTAAATIRNRLIALPGRLVNRSGTKLLRLPANWPAQNTFHIAYTNISHLPQLC